MFALAAAAVVRRRGDAEEARRATVSACSWLVLVTLFGTALHFGPAGLAVLMAVVAVIGLGEYARLLPGARRAVVVGSFLLPLVTAGILLDWQSWFLVVAPTLLLVAFGLRIRGGPRAETGVVGPLLTLVLLSYVVGLVLLPASTNPVAGSDGWVVWTVVLTGLNDGAQSFWGRRFGRRRLAPRVSPGKTWEGWLGGLGTTVVAAAVAAPFLTPWIARHGAAGGTIVAALVAVGLSGLGLLGDLRMSTMKRALGVKDSGRIVPGQGGMLDRIDSLLFTAPAMFALAWWGGTP